MKKLVLVFAMMFGAVGVFAQGNNMLAKKINKEDLLTQASAKMMSNSRQNPIKKSYADDTYELCNFSDASTYTFGTTSRHTSAIEFELLNTSLDLTTWWTLAYFRTDLSNTSTWVNRFEPNEDALMPMSVTNGFAGLNLREQESTESVEATIKMNTPITTNGSGIDIHFVQFLYALWNYDVYFIDWSTDPNFAAGSYDSIAFNVKNIDATAGDAGNENLYGRKVVNIPTGTSICNVATSGQTIYIRFRAYSQEGTNNGGLQWFVDDISYAWAPADRIEYLSYTIDDGYRKVPSILEPEPFRSSVIVQNTGSATATNLRLANTFYSVAQDGEDVVFTQISQATTTTPVTLANQIVVDDDGNASRYISLGVDTSAIPQPGTEVGTYAYTADLLYTINNEEKSVNLDTNYYYVVGEDAARSHCYTWQKDMGIFWERYSGVWNYYFPNAGTYSNGPVASTDGYRTCVAYTKYTNKINGLVYASGVEVVPAIDSCEAGAVIKASLWKWNGYATSMDERIIEETDNNEIPVQSEEHVVLASELNNSTDPDNVERFTSDNTNTIYMPFTYQAAALEDSSIYYACYTKVGSNGKFYVAKNYDYWTSFSYDNGYSILVWSPTIAGTSTQYDWGYVWFTQSWSNGSIPAIRLIVSDINNPNPSSIEDVRAEATSDMQVYPNPATDNVTLSYTLNQSGNVNITITDIMGRVVLSENQGKKESGFAYKTSINTSNMNNGTYFYTVEVNGAKSTNKLVINR